MSATERGLARLPRDPGAAESVYSWFRASADRHPEGLALHAQGESLRYRELAERVEELSGRIRRIAPGDTPAALLADRSVGAYIGYLALSRLGRAVVPISPAHPIQRNRRICSAAGVGPVVGGGTAGPLAASLGATGPDVRVAPDAEVGMLSAGVDAARGADQVAYVLFTSGSTGGRTP